MSRFRCLLYLGAALMGGVFVLLYRGPYWPIIRSSGGDWLVVQAIYLVGRLWIDVRWRFRLASVVFIFGVLIEIFQFFSGSSIPQTFLTEVTVGSTFDPGDIIAYALGLVTVLLVEQLHLRPKTTVSPPI